MNMIEKLFLWLFPTHNEVLIQLFNLNNLNTRLKEEIECNRSYIEKCEERIKELKEQVKVLKSLREVDKKYIEQLQIPIKTEKSDPNIKVRSQEGWHFIDDLPIHSIPECIVTDGEIVQVVQWDHNTKQFLKVFGSQSMYVNKPIAWMPMPLPPENHKGILSDLRSSLGYMANTYLR